MSFKLNIPGPGFYTAQSDERPGGKIGTGAFDKVAPDGYHATTIFPEYFKVGSQWLLAEESRTVCVFENGKTASVNLNLKRVTWYSPEERRRRGRNLWES